MNIEFSWPPPFTLRHSQRARRVSLKLCPRRGLELVVPQRFNPAKSLQVLEEHRVWIERTWQKIQPQQINNNQLPLQINLDAINETWQIEYKTETIANRWLVIEKEKRIVVYGEINQQKLAKVLVHWLKQHARKILLPWLQSLSQQTGLSYKSASIRHVSTLWGSCSIRKTISLNCKLLFLPHDVVEYVLLHELCHTVHMNHAREFWNLLQQFSPNSHALRRQLKQSDRLLPWWVEEDS